MGNLLAALLGIYATGCMAESSADPADSEATTQAQDATPLAAHNDSFTVHTTDSEGAVRRSSSTMARTRTVTTTS